MTTKLMTNIDSSFYLFLDTESKKNNITKRELLERIIKDYIQNKKASELELAYKKMWSDSEYLYEMTENSKFLWNL